MATWSARSNAIGSCCKTTTTGAGSGTLVGAGAGSGVGVVVGVGSGSGVPVGTVVEVGRGVLVARGRASSAERLVGVGFGAGALVGPDGGLGVGVSRAAVPAFMAGGGDSAGVGCDASTDSSEGMATVSPSGAETCDAPHPTSRATQRPAAAAPANFGVLTTAGEDLQWRRPWRAVYRSIRRNRCRRCIEPREQRRAVPRHKHAVDGVRQGRLLHSICRCSP